MQPVAGGGNATPLCPTNGGTEHSAAKPQPKRTYRRDAENSEFFLSVCQPEFLNQVCSRVASARVCIGALQRRQRTQRKSSHNNKKSGASSTRSTRKKKTFLCFLCSFPFGCPCQRLAVILNPCRIPISS